MDRSSMLNSLEEEYNLLCNRVKESAEAISALSAYLLKKDALLLQLNMDLHMGDLQLKNMQSEKALLSKDMDEISTKIRFEKEMISTDNDRQAAEMIVSLTKKRKICEYQMGPGEICLTKCMKGFVCAKHAKKDSLQRNIKKIGLFSTRSNAKYGHIDSGSPSTGVFIYCVSLTKSSGVRFRNSLKNNPLVELKLYYRIKINEPFKEYTVTSFKENLDTDIFRIDLMLDPNGIDVKDSTGVNNLVEIENNINYKKKALVQFYNDAEFTVTSVMNTTFGIYYKR